MRELRFVRNADDGAQLIVETVDGGEQFTLNVDTSLRAAVLVERPAAAPAEAHPPLAPREIQIRVRAGQDAASIAAESGMSLEKVMRFAAPVLEERARLTDEARRARARRATPDGQLVNFGEYVDTRFAAHGVDPVTIHWDSFRDEDGQWVVQASWRGGDADRNARWAFTLGSRSVSPLDETAADLLSDRPIRPVTPPAPLRSVTPLDHRQSGGPTEQTGPMPRVVADIVEDEPVYDQEQDKPSASDADAADPAWDAPPLPLRLAEPKADEAPAKAPPAKEAPAKEARAKDAKPTKPAAAARGEEKETEEQKAARARVPSWDDILLGVRRKRD